LAKKSRKFIAIKSAQEALFVGRLGGIIPTPAGVMARDVTGNKFRFGLGGGVASYSNP